MSFSRPFTGSFSFEGIIPSASMNIVNNAIPNALDKTGDNAGSSPAGGISGQIEVLPTGSFLFDAGATLTVNGGFFLGSGALISINSGSSVFFNSGSTVDFEGFTTFISNTTFQANSLSLNSGALSTGLSFSNLIGTPIISQVGATAFNANGNNLVMVAQTGGAGTISTGGSLLLSGGVGGGTGGSVQLASGAGNIPGTVNLQQNYKIFPQSGTSGGQSGQIYRQVFICETSGTGTQSFVPYIFTLPGTSTYLAEATWTCHQGGIGGKYYSIGITGAATSSGQIYGNTAVTITPAATGNNLQLNITPPSSSNTVFQFDLYLQLN